MIKSRGMLEPVIPLLVTVIISLLLKGLYRGPWIYPDQHVALGARVWLNSHIWLLFPFHFFILLATLSWAYNTSFLVFAKNHSLYKIAGWLYVLASICIEFSLQTIVFPRVLHLSQMIRDVYAGVLVIGLITAFMITGGGGGLRVKYPKWMQWQRSWSANKQPSKSQ